jgi:transposase InsO family protein
MFYVEFTTRMHLPELIACHQRAFEFFGGWPRRILYDNMKQVRLSPSGWNPLMMDFLSHYGITASTHRPYRPRTKGEVERAIRYFRENFLKGREFADLSDLRAQGRHWQDQVANVRVHATTNARPCDLAGSEGLVPFASVTVYRLSERVERIVDAEGFVRLRGSRYSVPPEAVGRRVVVECGGQQVVVRPGEVVIAEHAEATRRGECRALPAHVAAMWRLAFSRTPVPSAQADTLLFQQSVAVRPLAAYEEVLG